MGLQRVGCDLALTTRNKVIPWVEKESDTSEQLKDNNKVTPPASSAFIEFSARHAPRVLPVLVLMYS